MSELPNTTEYRTDGTRGAWLGAFPVTRSSGLRQRCRPSLEPPLDGEELPIEEGPALQAVRAWVQAAGIKPGTPLWRTIRKGHVQPERMHQRTLHNIIQRRAEEMLRARRDEPTRRRVP